ncbi:hypothetical protein LOZ58_006814 [Ophidiomyces ophidiicola]|nr:hypothetical protein LOZ58_006814 [Ophidiomyces ophidiicola]
MAKADGFPNRLFRCGYHRCPGGLPYSPATVSGETHSPFMRPASTDKCGSLVKNEAIEDGWFNDSSRPGNGSDVAFNDTLPVVSVPETALTIQTRLQTPIPPPKNTRVLHRCAWSLPITHGFMDGRMGHGVATPTPPSTPAVRPGSDEVDFDGLQDLLEG